METKDLVKRESTDLDKRDLDQMFELTVYKREKLKKYIQSQMNWNVHFGLPGFKSLDQCTGAGKKPALLKSGAEDLCELMSIGDRYEELELNTKESLSVLGFKIKCTLFDKKSGVTLTEGIGSCFAEEKDGWKAEPLKFANSILKIAEKRAKVAATINATGTSWMFTQDLEDYSPEDVQNMNGNGKPASDKQKAFIKRLIKSSKISVDERDRIEEKLEKFTKGEASQTIDYILRKEARVEVEDMLLTLCDNDDKRIQKYLMLVFKTKKQVDLGSLSLDELNKLKDTIKSEPGWKE